MQRCCGEKKCSRLSINRIQSKNHKIGTYEINKISLSCFNDRISVLNNGCDGLPLGCYSWLKFAEYETKVILSFDLVKTTFLSS